MAIDIPGNNYIPNLTGYSGQGSFKFWCQKVLPIVYDDSLSYYELLNKVVDYLNNVIQDVSSVEGNIGEIAESFSSLQKYVNDNFEVIESFVNNLESFVNDYFDNLDVQNEINHKLDEMVTDGTFDNLVGPVVVSIAPGIITEWLGDHITPTTPIVDDTLSIQGAAADAKATGDAISVLNDALGNTGFRGDVFSSLANRFATGTYLTYDVSMSGLSKSGSTRLITGGLPCVINTTLVAELSGSNYQFVIVFNDSTVPGDTWSAGEKFYMPTANGVLQLKFKKTDGTNVSDSDVSAVLQALTIKYYPRDVKQNQLDDVSSCLTGTYFTPLLEQGSMNIASGSAPVYSTSTVRCRTPQNVFVYLDEGDTIAVTDSNYEVWISRVTMQPPHVGNNLTYSWAESTVIPQGKGGLYAVLIQLKAKTVITPTEAEAVLRITRRGIYDRLKAVIPYTMWVSPSGSDSASGDEAHPLATINQALKNGAKRVLLAGGKYFQAIYKPYTNDYLEIAPAVPSEAPYIYATTCLLSETETKTDGYTKVYQFEPQQAIGTQMYQDNVPEASTLISDGERHPLQRGREYRCMDTQITECVSDILSDALNEIDTSDEYKYFYDSANDIVYLSRPQTINSNNPICTSTQEILFTGTKPVEIKMSGINVKYLRLNVDNCDRPVVEDCTVSNVDAAGCYSFNNSINATFVRCEAYRANTGAHGDGFSAHVTTKDPDAKQATGTLIDCWSHDNVDDGYSNHECGETTVIGGLYEYNGGSGVIPAYGCHANAYNVWARKNGSGFFYAGEAPADEGGKYGQMVCYNCIADGNNADADACGFGVRGAGNKVTLINCVTRNNPYGYYADSNTTMELVNCTSSGDTSVTRGSSSRFQITNGQAVTPS